MSRPLQTPARSAVGFGWEISPGHHERRVDRDRPPPRGLHPKERLSTPQKWVPRSCQADVESLERSDRTRRTASKASPGRVSPTTYTDDGRMSHSGHEQTNTRTKRPRRRAGTWLVGACGGRSSRPILSSTAICDVRPQALHRDLSSAPRRAPGRGRATAGWLARPNHRTPARRRGHQRGNRGLGAALTAAKESSWSRAPAVSMRGQIPMGTVDCLTQPAVVLRHLGLTFLLTLRLWCSPHAAVAAW